MVADFLSDFPSPSCPDAWTSSQASVTLISKPVSMTTPLWFVDHSKDSLEKMGSNLANQKTCYSQIFQSDLLTIVITVYIHGQKLRNILFDLFVNFLLIILVFAIHKITTTYKCLGQYRPTLSFITYYYYNITFFSQNMALSAL